MKFRKSTPALASSTNGNVPAGGTMAVDADAAERQQMGRRALIAAAGLGVVGVVVAEKDNILKGVGNLTQQEIQNAINAGRQALANELTTLEVDGELIAVGAASAMADVTHNAVNFFVVPIANLLSGLTQITLDVAIGAVEKAQGFTQLLHIDVQALGTLDTIMQQWRTNVAAFPAVLQSLSNVDTASAHKYLSALQVKLEREVKH